MSAKTRRTAATAHPSENEIAQRAYQRWIDRGCPQGDGREDWFAAEAELSAAPPPRHRSPLRSALRRLGI